MIGRRNAFAKVFGLRIDLDQVEKVYGARGHLVHCAPVPGDGPEPERLVLAVDASARPVDADLLQGVAKELFGLPPRSVQVLALTEVPRLPNGKPDYRGIVARAAAAPRPGGGRRRRCGTPHSPVRNPALNRAMRDRGRVGSGDRDLRERVRESSRTCSGARRWPTTTPS